MRVTGQPQATLPVVTDIDRGACGVGFVADRYGRPSSAILQLGLTSLINLQHRGGIGADNETGDGAGVLTPIPRAFFAREFKRLTKRPPEPNALAVGMLFLRPPAQAWARTAFSAALQEHGCPSGVWRAVPTRPHVLGARARALAPVIMQVLLERPGEMSPDEFERRLFLARKAFERRAHTSEHPAYVVSLSARTIVYKGLLYAPQLSAFYPDLIDPDFQVSSVVFHQRYSTNTLPSWERAQPFRTLCHNGEINTIQGNIAWALARQSKLHRSFDHGPDFTPENIAPVVETSGSDSAMLDNYAELLRLAGRDPRHVFAMLMPMAWEKVPDLPPPIRAFYEYHAHVQEPWDGPAAVVFCDGRMVGATLDRNGLRPLRYAITDTGLIFASSEIGAVPCEPAQIVRVGKLGPGQLMALDLTTGEFFKSKQIKRRLAAQQPYVRRLQQLVNVPRLPKAAPVAVRPDLVARQVACGYTRDDSIFILKPMAINRSEPVGSMGDDTPPAVLSAHPRSLFGYFRQRFAEVTNPPIDPLREGHVMSLRMSLGRRGNALDPAPWQHAHVVLATPFLAPNQLDVLIRAAALPSARLETGWPAAAGPSGLASTLTRLQAAARQAVKGGAQLLVLSDRELPDTHAIIPAALAVGAVHHDLVRAGLRSEISLIIDSGEPRSVHDMAVLIGYGANVVCPHLALETVAHLGSNDPARATANYLRALEKGLLKIMSKMGISTVDAYCGAQIFECIGLSSEVVAAYFTGTPAHLGGATLQDIARLVLRWQANATAGAARLTAPGFFKFKRGGELHAFAPDIVRKLQRALASTSERDFFDGFELYMQFVRATEARDPIHLRDLLDIRPAGPHPIPINQVEPREALVQRFSTAAMSHGSLSSEAHETLAIAMNRLDSASNSGEGGERSERFGSERNSSIKQVASGRFGVTPAYLLAADELQIKMAQGAKPGEGGRLPGHKVTPEIASIRHAQPGVTLISPPPQHDIYSIEDLSQLIFDLRQINPRAKISVKLVAQSGIGTIAAGVAKAGADVIVIAGHSGGTGAAPWSSIKHAGLPWEIGLVETQRALIRAGLRGRVRLRADGGFCTGRDVLFAALLGADEFSFGTSALVAAGCVLARTCHTNNCPVGVATQRADLRAKYTGTPEQVMTYFHFVAEELRRRLAALGETRLKHLIGRTDLLAQTVAGRKGEPPLDLRELLRPLPAKERRYLRRPNPTARLDGLNESLLAHAAQALHAGAPVNLRYSITNRTRAFGATLSGEIIRLHGPAGLPEGTVAVTCFGTAGQSFGAFCAPGVQLNLYGPANDYVGKGMAGGTIVITSDEEYRGEHPFLAGNTILYGATGGELFIAGRVGERFAVRNSGAFAIAEDVGDHGCEYMTGGTVVVLGTVGHNFAAGMTGGVAYVYDRAGHLAARLNRELVTQQPLATGEARQLARWLLRHAELTGSPLADQLLANWDEAQAYFACIRPKQPPPATVDAVAPFSRELTTA